jgi:hypothetical protein
VAEYGTTLSKLTMAMGQHEESVLRAKKNLDNLIDKLSKLDWERRRKDGRIREMAVLRTMPGPWKHKDGDSYWSFNALDTECYLTRYLEPLEDDRVVEAFKRVQSPHERLKTTLDQMKFTAAPEEAKQQQ